MGGESSFIEKFNSFFGTSEYLKFGGIEASRIPLELTWISNGNSFSNLASPHTDFYKIMAPFQMFDAKISILSIKKISYLVTHSLFFSII